MKFTKYVKTVFLRFLICLQQYLNFCGKKLHCELQTTLNVSKKQSISNRLIFFELSSTAVLTDASTIGLLLNYSIDENRNRIKQVYSTQREVHTAKRKIGNRTNRPCYRRTKFAFVRLPSPTHAYTIQETTFLCFKGNRLRIQLPQKYLILFTL